MRCVSRTYLPSYLNNHEMCTASSHACYKYANLHNHRGQRHPFADITTSNGEGLWRRSLPHSLLDTWCAWRRMYKTLYNNAHVLLQPITCDLEGQSQRFTLHHIFCFTIFTKMTGLTYLLISQHLLLLYLLTTMTSCVMFTTRNTRIKPLDYMSCGSLLLNWLLMLHMKRAKVCMIMTVILLYTMCTYD